MLAGQQEVGRRLPTAEGRQRRAAREAFSARRRRERGVKGAKKGQGGGQTGPGRRLGTWLKAACALARQGAGSLGVSAAGRARAGGGGRVCSSLRCVLSRWKKIYLVLQVVLHYCAAILVVVRARFHCTNLSQFHRSARGGLRCEAASCV